MGSLQVFKNSKHWKLIPRRYSGRRNLLLDVLTMLAQFLLAEIISLTVKYCAQHALQHLLHLAEIYKPLYLNLRNVRVSEIAEDVDSVNLSGVIKIEFSRVQVTSVCQFHVVQN